MVGKARSSNFTLSEKLDLLKLVRPHIRILEEHTNKHAVIVDKNKCWDTVAEQYNALGGDRPHRTAQGLRTLYKRLKESAKQEVMQRRHAQPEYRASISEPTRRIMEMIPHLFHHVPIHEKDQALRRYSGTDTHTSEGILQLLVGGLAGLDTNYQYRVLILIEVFEKERGQGLNSENNSDNTISDNNEIQ